MDVDQTVPIENTSLNEINTSQDNAEPTEAAPSPALNQFQEVADVVSALKKVNESFMTRLRTALEDDNGAYAESRRSVESVSGFSFCYIQCNSIFCAEFIF